MTTEEYAKSLKTSPFTKNIYLQIAEKGTDGFNPTRNRILNLDKALMQLAELDVIVLLGEELVLTRHLFNETVQRFLKDKKNGDELSLEEAKTVSGMSRRVLIPVLEAMDGLGYTAFRNGKRTVTRAQVPV